MELDLDDLIDKLTEIRNKFGNTKVIIDCKEIMDTIYSPVSETIITEVDCKNMITRIKTNK